MHLILMTLLTLLPSPANPAEQAIRLLISRYVEAREKIDPGAVEPLFTAEADQLVSSGEWRRGRPALVAGTTASSRRNPGHRSITIDRIRFLSSRIAIVDARYELAGQNGSASRKMWSTLIVQRSKQGWQIAAIRNMLPAPPAGTS
ncbi:MAG: SgcJ/EcaC family oxidoreductase [Blastocatellia bacterium]